MKLVQYSTLEILLAAQSIKLNASLIAKLREKPSRPSADPKPTKATVG